MFSVFCKPVKIIGVGQNIWQKIQVKMQLFSHHDYLYLAFTTRKVEQPLEGVELQGKEDKEEKHIKEIIRKSSKLKQAYQT